MKSKNKVGQLKWYSISYREKVFLLKDVFINQHGISHITPHYDIREIYDPNENVSDQVFLKTKVVMLNGDIFYLEEESSDIVKLINN